MYYLVSTKSDKVRVGSVWGDRLATYRYHSGFGGEPVSKWIMDFGKESLRIIPMVVVVCSVRDVRRLEQQSINCYGCELNTRRACLLEEEEKRGYDRVYHEVNKERGNRASRRYYESHGEEMRARWREKVTCGCGSGMSRSSTSTHIRSQKHLAWVIDID